MYGEKNPEMKSASQKLPYRSRWLDPWWHSRCEDALPYFWRHVVLGTTNLWARHRWSKIAAPFIASSRFDPNVKWAVGVWRSDAGAVRNGIAEEVRTCVLNFWTAEAEPGIT